MKIRLTTPALHSPPLKGSRNFARGFALALLTAPLLTQAGPRTLELFNETMEVAPVRTQGAKLYQRYCMECHGNGALGDAGKVVPGLAGQVERYLVKQLVDFSELDREAPEMHRLMARPDLDGPQEWRDLAAWLASLRPNLQPQVGSGRDLEHGARSYSAYCASCHGRAGEGLAEAPIPALRGQHYAYLLVQLKSFDADRRSNLDGLLLEHMVTLSRRDMEALSDYISRLVYPPVEETTSAIEPRPFRLARD